MAFWKSSLPANTKLPSQLPARFLMGLSTLFLFLGGCTVVGPGFVQPDVQMLSQQYQARDFQQPSIELDSWWRSFSDPILEQLVSQALANNLTVQLAAERIIEARANVNLNGGNLAPNVTSNTGYEYLKRSPNARPFVGQNGSPFQLFTSGFDSTWEIDLFGRLERLIQTAEAELLAQEYSLQDVQQTLVADVATSYLSIRLLQNQIQTIDQSLMLQKETSRVVDSRADAGVATKLDAEQTQAFLHRSQADKAILELQLDCEFNRLSILLGESPAPRIRDFVGVGPIPEAPYIPDAGIPADLIRRRPDIRQVEAEVGAATARIGVAEADLYPTLTLLGSISLSAQDVSSLFQTDSLAFNVGPSFTWNILHFGRICDNIEIHQSRLRQTATNYRATVLNAVKEVEDAMAKYDGYRKQLRAINSAVQSDAKAVELSLQRYKIGKSNFQRVLDSQLQMLQDSQASAIARANSNIQLIRLYRAIGGGWPGHAGPASGGCNQSAAAVDGQANRDCGCWSDDQSLPQQVVRQGSIVQGQFGPSVQQDVPDSSMPTQIQRSGQPILQIDEVAPTNSGAISTPQNVLPASDFSPLEFNPEFGRVPQPSTPRVAEKKKPVTNELFDWSEQETAVVRSKQQGRLPLQGVTNADYFVESSKKNNQQETRNASAIRPAAYEWASETATAN